MLDINDITTAANREIVDALQLYAREVDQTPYCYGHILVAANIVLCFAEAKVSKSDPIYSKFISALLSLPIYGDEDMHWELVRAYTLARLQQESNDLDQTSEKIRLQIENTETGQSLFDDTVWGLFASSIVVLAESRFTNKQRRKILEWLFQIEKSLRNQGKFYLLSFAVYNRLMLSKSQEWQALDDSMHYISDLLRTGLGKFSYTDDKAVWDEIVQIADIVRQASYIDSGRRWSETMIASMKLLRRFMYMKDLRKRGQVLKALCAIQRIECSELVSVTALQRELGENEILRAKAISLRFRNYWRQVSEYDVYQLLAAAPSARIRGGLLDLLDQIRFFSAESLETMLFHLIHFHVPSSDSNALAALGDVTGSGGLLCYGIKHLPTNLRYTGLEGRALEGLPPEISGLVLVDDCSLSGTQGESLWRELFGEPRESGKFKYINQPMTLHSQNRLRNISIYILLAVSNTLAAHRLKSYLRSKGIRPTIAWGYDEPYLSKLATVSYLTGNLLDAEKNLVDPDMAPYNPIFQTGSPNWTTHETMLDTREFLVKVGYELLADTGFSETRRHESALGYSNAQKLLVFQHNVPKSSITALWKRGLYEGITWSPLFPERDRNFLQW